MSIQALREFINRHNASAAGLAALGAALDAHANGAPLEPPVAARVEELLGALGAGDLLADVGAQEARPFLAELRMMLAVEAKLLYSRTRGTGWTHTEPEILQNAGDVSAGFVQPLARMVVPALEGLGERLAAPGGAFLDVGVGVASLSIAVARQWPGLRIVGVDSWKPSMALARENVSRAGLGDRIELREQGAEGLADEAAFDLAWVPIPFIPPEKLRPVLEGVRRALRPGGWALLGATNPNLDAQGVALFGLRSTLFGNGEVTPGAAEGLLREAGLAEIRTLPSAPGAFVALVAGRRKPA